ncbi:hypothetical protein EKN06_11890 [Croceicoccus ponticola]|uniref:PilZ domain-containing protein n=1 Tax=Croceicoccus ponticola TaxID=2217664 RepID=A0A437GXS3_9SPHN|nr:PilZ domain-containing protein [Croceicoccus ponticola]RVQ66036.1 hypothetical protein EKN06_11890 [Croceicoccus ponticola]
MLQMRSLDDRRHARQSLKADGQLRKGVGIGQSVAVVDLSDCGCRITSIPKSLRRKDRVTLRIAGHAPVEGHLKWLHLGKEAGVQFDNPIHPAVFNQILASHRAAEARADTPSEHLMVLRGELEQLQD